VVVVAVKRGGGLDYASAFLSATPLAVVSSPMPIPKHLGLLSKINCLNSHSTVRYYRVMIKATGFRPSQIVFSIVVVTTGTMVTSPYYRPIVFLGMDTIICFPSE
jgi:hypothetical protein